jgi:hypothetical protein
VVELAGLTVQTKVVGRRGALASWEVEAAPAVSSLRDLIQLLVKREVAAFRGRQEERKLARVLSNELILDAAGTGRVHMGGDDLEQSVDETQAVEAALTAFRDGFYFVFVDEAQVGSLDDEIRLQPQSQLLFLRLTPLVGG